MTRVALKGLAMRPLRTILTALAIVLGVGMVTAAFTLSDTLRGAADSLSVAAYDGTDAVVTAPTAFAAGANAEFAARKPVLPGDALAKVRAIPSVKTAVGDITDQAQIIGRDGKPVGGGPYFGAGYDSRTAGSQKLTAYRLQGGRWATGPGEVVIDVASSEKESYALGSQVRVATRGKAGSYRVVGIARFGEVKALGQATFAVFDLRTAQDLFRKHGGYDSVMVAGRKGVAPAQVRRDVAAAMGSSAQVQTASAQDRFDLDGLKQGISFVKVILLVFGGVSVLVGAFTIFNTLSISVAQRSREFALLRMVGAGRAQVLRTVMVEALAVGLGASVLGLAAGLGIAQGLNALFESMDLSFPIGDTVFSARTIVVSLLVGTLVTLVAGLLPARRATRIAPVAALREADPAGRRVRLPGRIVRAATSLLGRPAAVIGGQAGRLARANSMRQPGRTAVTASALMIGVALVTLVAVVAQGLRSTTSGSLERRVAATHVVTGQDGWSAVDGDVAKAVAGVRGVRTVSAIPQDAAQAFGDTELINAVDPATIGKVFSFEWKEGSTATLAGLGSDGAVVDEGWATEHRLKVGDPFSITSIRGDKLALRVDGIEKSPVLDLLALGPITISRQAYESAFEGGPNYLTLVDAKPSANLRSVMAAFPEAKAFTKQGWIEKVSEPIDAVFAIFAVLLLLAVIVSLFGIVNTLVLSTFERTRELGMMRAIGMSRRQVRRMIRHESVITAMLGAATGIAVGLGLAAIVTAVFADDGLAFALPIGSLIAFTVVAIVAGVLAAILPARRASRLDVLTALAYE
jgi:putative ABC transport system permease protein